MAITNSTPTRAKPSTPAGPRGSTAKVGLNSIGGKLKEAGLLNGTKSAKLVGTTLTAGLSARGFIGSGADLLSQLTSALKDLQAKEGLQVTGSLDAKTMEALKKMGLVESSIGVAPGSHTNDAFEVMAQKGAQTTLTAPDGQPLENAMDTFLTAISTVLEGILNESMTHAAKDEASAHATSAVVGQAAETPDESHLRRDGAGDKDPNGKGAEQGDASDKTGRAKKFGDQSGRVGDGDEEEGSAAEGEDRDGAAADGDEDGSEHEAGNAPSGDDDLSDPRRGHASVGDDDVLPGHYRIPTLEDQVRAALTTLKRTEATANRGTTYTLDVVLRRPGVYGPHQKAQEFLHLVVEDAGAYDDVWEKARESLRRLCNVAEPKADLPTREDWDAALRRARVHEPTA